MRASRLLAILLALRVRGQVGAAQLAAEHEVSLRTIYRDFESLSAAGVPVYSVRGRSGGYRLVDGFRGTVSALSDDEAGALAFAGLPGPAAELGLGSVLAAAQLKLLAALPAELRTRASQVGERFLLDAPGWLAEPEAPPLLATVADAVWTERELTMRYQRTSDSGPVDRTVAPLGLVLKAGHWYLAAAPSEDGTTTAPARTYRISRVLSASSGEQQITRPDGWTLDAFWADYQASYARRIYRDRATVRLGPRARQLSFLLGRIPAAVATAEASDVDPAGWVTTDVPIESIEHGLHALLQLGDEVEVLAPDELRERVAATVRVLADRYG